MQVQHHVGSAVADFGIGMSRQIVEKFGDILGGLVGGLGLTRINVLTAGRMIASTART